MPKVTFKTDGIEVEVEEGAALVDVAQEAGSTIDFACTDGVCGTCLVKVEEGKGNLSEKTDNEKSTLEMIGAEEGQRLACQCKVKGDVVLENHY